MDNFTWEALTISQMSHIWNLDESGMQLNFTNKRTK